MKTILLTGASGFIGKQVLINLLAQNYRVIAPTRNPQKLKSFQNHRNLEILECDIYAKDLQVKCDVLVHLAWGKMDDVRDFSHIESNFIHSLKFLQNAIKCGVKQVAVAGSCFEYGAHWGKVSEECIPNPQTSYGIAKVFLQKTLFELQRKYDFYLKWLRIFYLHGEGQNPHSLIPQLQNAMDLKKASFDMSGGEQMRDYLDIKVAAKYIANIALNDDFNGICNICSGAPISIRNLIEQYLQKTNQKIKLNFGFYPYPNYEPLAYFGDNSKLKSLLKNCDFENPSWGDIQNHCDPENPSRGGAERDESRIIFAIFAESNHICHSEHSEESQKKNLVILSKAKYLKNNNRDSSLISFAQNDNMGDLAQNDNLRKFEESGVILCVDSANYIQIAESSENNAESSVFFTDSAPRKKVA